jgi:glyoxylate reductase
VGVPRVDVHLLDAFPSTRLIASFGLGTDHIDLGAAAERGIGVTNTPGVVERPTAELTVGLMIGLLRRLREGDAVIRAGGWPKPGLESMLGLGLENSILGIIGLGGVGRQVARLATVFGMDVVYTQRHRLDAETERDLKAQYLGRDELLASADVVTLHCPMTPETHHLIDAAALALMRPSAFLINASRGPVVDEAALVAALRAGTIAGAALDVYEYEPRVSAELLELGNVFLTPHMGSATPAARAAMTDVLVRQIEAFATGAPPGHMVVSSKVSAPGS